MVYFLGTDYDEQGCKVALVSKFSFSHLDPENRTRAIFRDGNRPQDVKPLLSKRFASMFRNGIEPHRPRIYVQLSRSVNDTDIPDFEPNWDALEIKCNWMGMYSEYMKERREYSRRMSEWVCISLNVVICRTYMLTTVSH